jgi:hypothetical protein
LLTYKDGVGWNFVMLLIRSFLLDFAPLFCRGPHAHLVLAATAALQATRAWLGLVIVLGCRQHTAHCKHATQV